MSTPSPSTLPIKTHHCRFCANLLIATTRSLSSLPTRTKNTTDSATILPLRNHTLESSQPSFSPSTQQNETETETQPENEADGKGGGQKHYTILLNSSTRSSKPSMIRRSDGFEKRYFLRCGRCRVVVGYFLDDVHYPTEKGPKQSAGGQDESTEGGGEDRAVYLLPGALMETEIMSDEEKMRAVDREWASWFK